MATERRWGIRRSIEVDVVIDNQPACLLRGRIGNVSTGGLFVRTEPAGLAMNAQIELVLMLQREEGMQVYRLPAVVARKTAEGAGLRFDQYDVHAFRTLVVLLLARQRVFAPEETIGARLRERPDPGLPTAGNDVHTVSLALEGTTARIAMANGPVAPVTATSPVHGESH